MKLRNLVLALAAMLLMPAFVMAQLAPVAGLRVERTTINSVTVAWDAQSNVQSYVVEYGLHGFAEGSGTRVSVAQTLHITIPQLAQQTCYDVYVSANYGAWGVSESRMVEAVTLFEPYPLPFRCGFETASVDADWRFAGVGGGNGWMIGHNTNHGGDSSLYVSNLGGQQHDSNAYINVATVSYAWIGLVFDSAGTYSISFDWRCGGEPSADYMRVALAGATAMPQGVLGEPADGMGYTTLPAGWRPLDGGQGMTGATQWNTYTANFAVDTAGLYKLVFCWVNNNSRIVAPPAAVDNIRVERATCAAVEGLRLTQLVHDGARVEWYGGRERVWLLEYGEVGSALQSRTWADTMLNLTNLTPNTRYGVRVAPVCGYSDTGMATYITFTTPCAPVGMPYHEAFDGDGCLQWRGAGATYSGGAISLSGNGTTYLLLPSTTVSTDSLRLFMRYRMQNTEHGVLTLGYMDNIYNEGSFRPLATLDGSLSWTAFEHDFGYDGAAGRGGHIALRYITPDRFAVLIDTLSLQVAAGCRKALSLAVTQVSTTNVGLQWRAPGSGMLWQVEYGASGYTPFSGNEILRLLTTNNGITLDRLAPATAYDVYVRPVCGNGDTGIASRIRIRTNAAQTPSQPPVIQPNCGTSLHLITARLPLDGNAADGVVWQYYNAASLTAADFGDCYINSLSLEYTGTMEDSIYVQAFIANGRQTTISAMNEVAADTFFCVPHNGLVTLYLNPPYHYPGAGDITVALRAIGNLDTVQWGNILTLRHCNSSDTTHHNVYADYNPMLGLIDGVGEYATNDIATLRARPVHGYRFGHWANGDTSSVLSLVVHRDTTLTDICFVLDSFDINALSNNVSAGTVRGRRRAAYMNSAALTAVPAAGYHFTMWADGATDNPRTITLMGDTTVVALFAIDTYQVSITSNIGGGTRGSGRFTAGSIDTIRAVDTLGYRFYQWNDGSTANPRIIAVVSDTVMRAQFVTGKVRLTVTCNDTMGTTQGSGLYTIGQNATISVQPRAGYRFLRWSDNAITNPRHVRVSVDTTYEAVLVHDTFSITVSSADTSHGNAYVSATMSASSRVPAGSRVIIEAVPRDGFMFVSWQDGNTANPRTVAVNDNAVYVASFTNAIYRVRVDYDTSRGTVTLAMTDTVNNNQRIGTGYYGYGDTVRLTATPRTGYHFAYWDNASSAAVRLLRVEADTTLVARFEPDRYMVYVHSSNEAWGTVSGSGSYDYGSTLTIAAHATAGYRFTHWSDSSTDNPRQLTIGGNAYYTAYFERASYHLTVLSDNLMLGNVTGGGHFRHGDTTTVSAIPLPGCRFVGWSDGTSANPRRITVTRTNYLIARFATTTYNVAVTCNDTAKGSVIGSGTYRYGATAVIIATAAQGYRFSHWREDGNVAPMRSIVVTADTNFIAVFVRDSCRITAYSISDSMGTTRGSGTYAYGDTAEIVAVPAPGYHFTGWSNGSTVNPLRVEATGDMVFTASFAAHRYIVNVLANNDTMGYTYGSGSYSYGTSVSLAAVARQGYRFTGWSDGVLQNPRTLVVTRNVDITAIFRYGNCVLTVLSNDTMMGTVTGGGYYSSGSQATLTAVANAGYHFSAWNDGVATARRTVTVSRDTSFTAIFDPDLISVSVAANNNVYGYVSGGGTYQYGQTVSIEAMPFSHCVFLQWDDGTTDNPRQFIVSNDVSFTAIFSRESYSIEGQPSAQDRGYVTGSGMYYYGDTVLITAVGYTDYAFAQWEDGSTENPRRIIVTSDESHTATFVDAYYTISLSANDSIHGRVHGSGVYPYQHYLTISALADPGYRFVRWSDNNTERIRSFVVTSNMTLQAIFVQSNGIEQAGEAEVTVYSSGNEIVVEGYDGALTIYDAIGRTVVRDNSTTASRRFRMPTAGVYMVKTNYNAAPHKVLVIGEF